VTQVPRPSPIVLVLVGIASVQLGASVAKSMFDEMSPTTIVWLRLLTSAVVLTAFARPRLRGRSRDDLLVVLAFGASLGLMNLAIYQAFARIPLGIAVTLEFVGPLTLALLGSRRARDLVWVGLAAAGVVLLGAERADLDVVGVLFALLAGALWATYILLSGVTGRRFDGLDGLALASVVGALLLTPLLVTGDTTAGLVALRSMRPAVFGILMSLEPAAAALAGMAVLDETLTPVQWLAAGCVIAASVGATRQRGTLAAPVPD
jgi:inner membrane transporter RhtA